MEENTAESPDPERGIEPIRTKPRGRPKGMKRNKFKKSKKSLPDIGAGDMDLSDDNIYDSDSDNEDEDEDDDDDNNNDYSPNGALPSFDTLDMYIKAAVDLQLIQKTDPTKSHMVNEQTPRCPAVRTLMTKHLNRLAELKSSVDSDNVIIEDGHGLSTLKQILKQKWTHNYISHGGGGKHKLIGLRSRVFDSWSHFMMTRGESARMALMPDVFSHAFETLDNHGQQTFGVVLMMFRGKTNREGKQQHGVIVRNKDVEICPIGCLAFYLVELWMVGIFNYQLISVSTP